MRKNLNKSIQLNASPQKVWEVLQADKYTRIWYAEFKEGSFAETDWKLESKAIFNDGMGNGMIGRIVVSDPYRNISIEYDGLLMNGVEDIDSEDAQHVKGGREVYNLVESEGGTQLTVGGDISEEYFDMMSAKWDKALLKIKELLEE